LKNRPPFLFREGMATDVPFLKNRARHPVQLLRIVAGKRDGAGAETRLLF